jgi:hypothetical protein
MDLLVPYNPINPPINPGDSLFFNGDCQGRGVSMSRPY